jgi:hypothetical protein
MFKFFSKYKWQNQIIKVFRQIRGKKTYTLTNKKSRVVVWDYLNLIFKIFTRKIFYKLFLKTHFEEK